MDIFSDEPKERAVAEVSSDEDFFTKEEWKVTKFIDRHTDVSDRKRPATRANVISPVRGAVFAGQVADWGGNVGARTRDSKE